MTLNVTPRYPQLGERQRLLRQRDVTDLSVSALATPFGCCNFFDNCADGVMSLHFNGNLGLLDWMGFNPTDECYRTVEFITWKKPTEVQGECSPGYLADPCDDPYGFEYGSCKLTYEDFGRLGRMGPVREMMRPKKYCRTSPRFRLDGRAVTDETEWDMRFATEVLMDDLRRLIITGSDAVAGQFDGVNAWVRDNYDCEPLDSIIVDWNDNAMAGGAGITWNGAPVAATFDLVEVVLAAFRRIKQRIGWVPMWAGGVPDMILVMPSFMIDCFLDFYTCWTVCPGTESLTAYIDTYEGRNFRNSLLGGRFGNGRIWLDGVEISLMAWDWGTIVGPTRGDMYLLTGAIGANRIWEGEHLSALEAARRFGGLGYSSTDGGRILVKTDVDNECYRLKEWIHPRLFCSAPWAQVRIQDVVCNSVAGPLSPDPCDTSYFYTDSFTPAECPS